METTLTIQDLPLSEELDRAAMAATCGAGMSLVPRNLINQELTALTIVGTGSTFAGDGNELRVNNRYSQSASQVDGGSNVDALLNALHSLGQLGHSLD